MLHILMTIINVRKDNRMINFILWIALGALAGWIASIITKTNDEQGAFGNILTGIIGAFIGGFIVRTLTGNDVEGFSITSLIVAVLGAVILISLLKAVRGGKGKTKI